MYLYGLELFLWRYFVFLFIFKLYFVTRMRPVVFFFLYVLTSFCRLLVKRTVLLRGRRQFVSSVLRHALKLRYWIATGGVGGGGALNNVSGIKILKAENTLLNLDFEAFVNIF